MRDCKIDVDFFRFCLFRLCVIAGYDFQCCEDDEWVARNSLDESTTRGKYQPHYLVLVNEDDTDEQTVAYVPEDLLALAEDRDRPVEHQFMYYLFYGEDNEGNYIPSKPLREKYGVDRRDSYPREGKGKGDGGGYGVDAGIEINSSL